MSAPLPNGYFDPRDMDTATLEDAVREAQLELAEDHLPENVNADTRTWLETATRELEQRHRVTITARDGEPVTATLETRSSGVTLNLTCQNLTARLPLTAFLATLLARKLEQRVIA
jgi:hypothetical protein